MATDGSGLWSGARSINFIRQMAALNTINVNCAVYKKYPVECSVTSALPLIKYFSQNNPFISNTLRIIFQCTHCRLLNTML